MGGSGEAVRLLETVTVLAELGDVDACFVQGQAIEMQRLYKLLPDVVQVHTTGAILRAWDVFKVTQRVGDFVVGHSLYGRWYK